MDSVLDNVDGYWRKTFAAADLPRPRVRHRFVRQGGDVATGCGDDADESGDPSRCRALVPD